MNKVRIKYELKKHMDEGGTLNDCYVDLLYREAHIVDGDTDLEDVERWAFELLNGRE